MRITVRALGIALAAAGLLGMAWASRAPLRVALEGRDAGGSAVVRISLGARPERIESCRTQTDEELAKLAPQMRQRVVCEGVTARYQLEVRRDGALLFSQVVRGGGLRRDRQLYVSRELAVPAGNASFSVRLARIDTVAARNEKDEERNQQGDKDEKRKEERMGEQDIMAGRGAREAEERRRRREESVPAELGLTIDASLEPREVLLVTYDAELRTLRAVRAPR